MTRKQDDSTFASILKRQRWGAGDAEVVLSAWRKSGDSLTGFARRHGLQAWRLRYWVQQPTQGTAIQFRPVKVVAGSTSKLPADSSHLELVLRGGRRVVVHRGFDAGLLEELVRAVESWPC